MCEPESAFSAREGALNSDHGEPAPGRVQSGNFCSSFPFRIFSEGVKMEPGLLGEKRRGGYKRWGSAILQNPVIPTAWLLEDRRKRRPGDDFG